MRAASHHLSKIAVDKIESTIKDASIWKRYRIDKNETLENIVNTKRELFRYKFNEMRYILKYGKLNGYLKIHRKCSLT